MTSVPAWGAYNPGLIARVVILASRHTPLGRGSLRRLLYRMFEHFHIGPVDTLLNGVPVRLHPARNVCERKALMRPDRRDVKEHLAVREIMAKGGAVFLDIGANAGLFSLDAAVHAGVGGRIVAVEPNAKLIARLRFNEMLAREAGRIAPTTIIETCAVAVSDRDGDAYLSGEDDEGSRSLSDSATGRRVPTRTLVGLLGEHGIRRIDVLKIDIEGHEDRVLMPFLAAAPAGLLPCVLIMEHVNCERWSGDCLAACHKRGYRVRLKTRSNTILGLAAKNA